jgi:hypothetical protein
MGQLITGVDILVLENQGNTKGSVFEWKDFPVARLVQLTTIERKKGQLFGNHFHKGEDPSKNPEMFFLASGSLELRVKNKFTREASKTILHAGMGVVIKPHILHAFHPLTNIVGIEPRVSYFDKNHADCYSAEAYETYTLEA